MEGRTATCAWSFGATVLDTLATVWGAAGAAWQSGEVDVLAAEAGTAFKLRRIFGTMLAAMPPVVVAPSLAPGTVLAFPAGAVRVYVSDQ